MGENVTWDDIQGLSKGKVLKERNLTSRRRAQK